MSNEENELHKYMDENSAENTDKNLDGTPAGTSGENSATTTAEDAEQPTRSGFMAIIGKPNVGKSTLLNTLLGVKVAPITPKPQTTRRGVRGIYTEENRQLVFVDTPGLHRGGDTMLDRSMHREIRDAVVDVDLILWVVDLRRPPGGEDKDVARLLAGVPDSIPVFIVGNKVDAAKYPDEALNLYRELYPKAERVIAISALNDPKAVYALRDDLLDRLEENPFFFPSDIRSDQTREQWVAELIREAAMIHLRQEIPYSVAVQVVDWQDGAEDRPTVITAEIWVEKSGHRRIVVGKGGAMIKEIGKMARKQLEIFMQEKLFLELEVVVRSEWRRDRESLRELGYEP
ncbi:MAG TPA: GTPase Era [Trueperaceae bacterium]|nr:GTPase Era [Trueperaceae bacterium]